MSLFSQETPKVTLNDSNSGQLKLTHLNISVNIIGNFATTTYDMKFYNELDRTLEGELSFPLGEGQSVSQFAMEVNGKMRDAVIVEKELARVAFESTVRQTIDPGLLEKTEGNNYKARIYPILPKTYKQLVITYEQELTSSSNFQLYELPLGITETLDDFSVSFSFSGATNKPFFKKNPYADLIFKKSATVTYQAHLKKHHCTAQKPIIIQIPVSETTENVSTSNDYFHIYKSLKSDSKLKKKPKKIILLWDNSYSLQYRDVRNELNLLKGYISYLQNVKIQFIAFSDTIHKNINLQIKNGDYSTIEQLISNTTYDGGTSFKIFDNASLDFDEILLFSDGLSNLGNFTNNYDGPIYAINSSVSANHENLSQLTTQSGGSYLNLLRLTTTNALDLLKRETLQYLGYNTNKEVYDVYPKEYTNINHDFSLSGRFNNDTTIELLFGYGGKVTSKIKVPVKVTSEASLVKRLWAKQRLSYLNKDRKNNRKDIITLAKKHHLITDFTSMLILDRVEDYARYKIKPPQELKEAYLELIADFKSNELEQMEDINDRKEELNDDFEDLLLWHKTKFPKKKPKKTTIATNTTSEQSTESNNQTNENNNSETTTPIESNTSVISSNITEVTQDSTPAIVNNNSVVDPTTRTISGIVMDENNIPLPGATVLIKGTTTGTSTDFDGKYIINAEEGDILEVSYVGYAANNNTVSSSNTLNVALEADNTLDEVVVTALAIKRTSSKTTISSESVISNALAGKVTGIDISSSNKNSSEVKIRGTANITDSTPLYIIDGIVSEINSLDELNKEDIEEINTLNHNAATGLYGSRAANGVIIITTKKGKAINKEAIEKLNNEIAEKVELKSWDPTTPYITILEKELTVEAAYQKYLEIRTIYANSPSFYLDVADFFDKKENQKIAVTVLTNLMEVELNDHELIKALAYKLEYFNRYDLAIVAYQRILELRPENPQSYRDLALAYEHLGEIQKSFKLLYKIVNGDLLEKDIEERYYGIEHIAYVELCRLTNKYKRKLQLTKEQKNRLAKLPLDIRVVIDWNHDNTDIDLWVVDPDGEKAFYKNNETKLGGRMSEDLTEGYGPESFMLKKAKKGSYKVLIDYYAENTQKISGPTILKVTFFIKYGTKKETRKTVTVRLDKEEEELEIGNFIFN